MVEQTGLGAPGDKRWPSSDKTSFGFGKINSPLSLTPALLHSLGKDRKLLENKYTINSDTTAEGTRKVHKFLERSLESTSAFISQCGQHFIARIHLHKFTQMNLGVD